MKERGPGGPELSYNFYFEGGLRSYVKYLVKDTETRHPMFLLCRRKGDASGSGFQYTRKLKDTESFANNIFTQEGSTHLTGFRWL